MKKYFKKMLASAIVFMLIIGMVPMSAMNAYAQVGTYPVVTLDNPVEVTITSNNEEYVEFIPVENELYRVYSTNNSNENTPYFVIYDSSMSWLNGGTPFADYDFVAGETYYIGATFCAYNGDGSGSFDLNIAEVVDAQSIVASEEALVKYEGLCDYRVVAEFLPINSRIEEIEWSSDNTDVCTIDDDGNIKFISEGTATITATSSRGLTDSFPVTVKPAINIGLDDEISGTIESGIKNYNFKFIPPSDGHYRVQIDSDFHKNAYICNAEGEIGVSNDGYSLYLTAELTGGETYYIVNNAYDEVGDFVIWINQLVPATGFEILEGKSKIGCIGEGTNLVVEFSPSNCIGELITWESDNEAVAAVNDDGYIEYISAGTATITGTSENGLTDTCTVTVIGATEINLDEEITLNTNVNTSVGFFKFTPTEDGTYYFYSYNNDIDTYGYIYDSEMNELTLNDDGGDNNNFKVEYYLNAGETYYLKSRPFSLDSVGSYSVKIIKAIAATSMEIVNGETETGYVGQGTSLDVRFFPEYSSTESVTWASDNEAVATVDEDGYVKYISAGTATITATSENGLVDTYIITVIGATEINLDEEITLNTNVNTGVGFFEFTPTEDGTYYFYSYNNDIDTYGYIYDSEMNELTLNNDGGDNNNFKVEYYLNAGETYYLKSETYSSEEGSYSVKIIKAIAATSMEIVNGETETGYVGQDTSLDVRFLPEYSSTESVTWTSDNEDVATVDEDGYVKYISAGTATITATSENGLTDTCTVTVKASEVLNLDEEVVIDTNVDSGFAFLEFTPSEDGIYAFCSYSENMGVYYYLYDSDMCELASTGGIDNTKLLYSLTAGETYYIKSGPYGPDFSYSIKVTKAVNATALNILRAEVETGYVGQGTYLDYEFSPYNCIDETVTWTSNNEAVATVDEDGYVKYISAGTATITATSENGLTDTWSITVKAPDVINLDEEKTLNTNVDSGVGLFEFVPSESGIYHFYSFDNDVIVDGCILDFEMNLIDNEYAFVENQNFRSECTLTAGETYYLKSETYSSEEGSYSVKIVKAVDATGLEIIGSESHSGYIGTWVYLNTKLNPSNAIFEDIAWTSDNKDVATVSEWGEINFISAGTATITATSENGFIDTCTITVKEADSISLNEEKVISTSSNLGFGLFEFTPSNSGEYIFYSYDNDFDTYGVIMDSEMNELAWNDDGGENYNFRLVYNLEVGQTYYFRAEPYAMNYTGSYYVKIVSDVCSMYGHTGGTATCTARAECEVCGEEYGSIDVENHSPSDTWTMDENSHWKICENGCGTQLQKTSHTGGTATCTAKAECEICGEEYGNLNSSNHSVATVWSKDANYHWKVCNNGCGTQLQKSAHSWNGGVVTKEATYEETGVKTYTCTVCGEQKRYAIAKKVLAIPTVSISNGTTGINVSWNKIAGANKYIIYRKYFLNGVWSGWTAIANTTSLSYNDTNAQSGIYYIYTVRAVNGSAMSDFIQSSSLYRLAAPTVSISNGTTGINVSWNKIAGANKYIIYRKYFLNGVWSGWTAIANTTSLSFNDTKAQSGIYYIYTVRAVNGSVMSNYTQSSSLYRLAAPTVSISNGTTGVNVSWNKINGAKKYTIYRRYFLNGKWSGWTAIANTTSLSYNDTKAQSGIYYIYTVRAVNGSVMSNYTQSSSLYRLAAPTVKTAKATNGIKVSWNKINGAKKYTIYRKYFSNGKWSGWTAIANTTAISYTDTAAKTGVYYIYTVRAVNGSVMSNYTQSASIKR